MGVLLLAIIIITISVLMFIFGPSMKISAPFSKIGAAAGVIIGFIMFIGSAIVVIDAGEVGVVVIFGNVQKNVLMSGIRVVPPYANIYKYSTRITELTEENEKSVEARAVNGLILHLDCTVLYSIDASKATEIYSKISTSLSDLQDKILLTTLRTVIRNVVSKYASEDVYSTKREQIQTEIEDNLKNYVGPAGLEISRFYIRAIKLPEEVDKSIQAKISAQQEAETMQFKKQKAEQEAEIKVIEAQGLANAQKIINSTLTANYLQHEAIQAYKELAGSPNTTFVIMPTNPNGAGMPLILNAAK